MRKTALHAITAVSFAALMVGCSNSDTTSPTQTAPTIPAVNFVGPTTNSSDTYAQITKQYALSANAYSTAFFGSFAGTNATNSGGSWSWSATSQGLTATFTATKQSDGSYKWKWILNGTSSSTGKSYSNWTLLDGTSSADGLTGEWKIYNDNTTTLAA